MKASTTDPSTELDDLILRALHGLSDDGEGAALAYLKEATPGILRWGWGGRGG